MPENQEANSDTANPQNADKNPSHAAHTPQKFVAVGLRRIILATLVGLGILIAVSIFLPNLKERVKFFSENALSLTVLAAIAVQTYINRKQWESMDRQVQIMGVAVDPRLRVTDVRIEDFQVGKEPVFVVSIINDGAFPRAPNLRDQKILTPCKEKNEQIPR